MGAFISSAAVMTPRAVSRLKALMAADTAADFHTEAGYTVSYAFNTFIRFPFTVINNIRYKSKQTRIMRCSTDTCNNITQKSTVIVIWEQCYNTEADNHNNITANHTIPFTEFISNNLEKQTRQHNWNITE